MWPNTKEEILKKDVLLLPNESCGISRNEHLSSPWYKREVTHTHTHTKHNQYLSIVVMINVTNNRLLQLLVYNL